MMTPAERLWAKVDKSGECWIWRGKDHNSSGYGRIQVDKKRVFVHRLAWELEHHRPPGKLNVLHHCDVPLCIRPSHLYLGTQSENAKDSYRRGRRIPAMCKLTEKQISEIRAIGRTKSQENIGRQYGISQQHVGRIISGTRWAQILELPI